MRSLWKGPFILGSILDQIKNSNNSSFKIMSTASIIFPTFINLTFEVYNGKKFQLITVEQHMIGKKFGEFINTKKPVKHK